MKFFNSLFNSSYIKLQLTQYLFFLLVMVIFNCCSSNSTETNSAPQLLIDNPDSTKVFLIQSDRDTSINTSKLSIFIPKYSFVNDSNKLVNGIISFSVQEYFSISEIVLRGLNSQSDNDLLETAGMLHISALKDSNRLYLKEGKDIIIKFKSTLKKEYQIFYGNMVSNESINWKPDNRNFRPYHTNNTGDTVYMYPDSVLFNNEKINDSISQVLNSFPVSRLGWINCDRYLYLQEDDRSELSVNFKTKKERTNFVSCIVLKNSNSIISGRFAEANKISFYPVPKNADGKLICLMYIDNAYFYYLQDILTDSNKSISIELQKISKDDLMQKIKSLNLGHEI